MTRFVWAFALLCACSPQDVLSRQGSTLRSTDYVQVAMDAEKKKQAEKEAQDKKAQSERDVVQRKINEAQAHMDLFEYPAAIVSYKEVYRLSNDPQYLVKIAEAERLTGDCREARAMYEQYLAIAKNPPDAKSVQARVEEAKSCETKAGSNIGEVRRFYQDGVTHYDLAEYEQAVKSFKEAYRLSNDPTYLFNIAQSYRMARNCSEAKRFYERLLAVQPDTPNKDKIETRIGEMKACAK